MKRFFNIILFSVAVPSMAQDPPGSTIQEAVLNTDTPMPVMVGAITATTLMFPEPVDTIIGYGLTDGESPGTYHYTHPDNSRLVALRNIAPGKEAFMTVVMGEELYVFHLQSSSDPVIALKLVKAKPKAVKVDPKNVVEQRLDFSVDGLLNLLKLARSETVLRQHIPQVYSTVESRYNVDAERRYDDVISVIRSIHRFPEKDTLVFAAELHNRRSDAVTYDVDRLRIRVGEREYAPTLVDASGQIAAGGAARVYLVIKGNSEGGKAHLSLENDFRLFMEKTETVASIPPTEGGHK